MPILFTLTTLLLGVIASSKIAAAIDCEALSCIPDAGAGFMTYKYGPSFVTADGYENQVADLYLPTTPTAKPIPIVV